MNHRHNSYARIDTLALTESYLLSAAVKELNHQCGVMEGGDWWQKISRIGASCIRVEGRWFPLWGPLCEPHPAVNGTESSVIEWAETGADESCVCV